MTKTNPSALRVEIRNLDAIRPAPDNPRRHSEEQIARVAESIKAFGWTNPILVDPEGEIIAGEGRWLAAHRLALTTVPVIVLDGLSPVERQAYRIADNQLPLGATWDQALLAKVLAEIETAGLDLGLTGFSDEEMAALLGPALEAVTTDFPELAGGERTPFQRMTFLLHDEQAAIVKQALDKAKSEGRFDDGVNKNSNGNALARVCRRYLDGLG